MEKVKHLQGIGNCQATEAANIKIGTILVWNYGSMSEVMAISPRGDTQIIITEKYGDNKTYTRILKKSRLVAFKSL